MPLTPTQAADRAAELLKVGDGERQKLDDARRYWKGRQALPAVIPSSAPAEVRTMARMARVNIIDIVVESMSQSLFVEGIRGPDDSTDLEVWAAWQANRMDKRQAGIHRVTVAYGRGYSVVLPGSGDFPVIRGASPRHMTAMYGSDPDWPVVALENRGTGLWALYDDEAVYWLSRDGDGRFEVRSDSDIQTHDAGVTPVVRFLESEDLDAEDEVPPVGPFGQTTDRLVPGQVGPLMALQDQVDFTTFNLLVAQHYSAFRQRYAIGWVAESEEQKMKAAASQLWTFEDHPDEVRLGEFSETNLDGYIKSREASIRHGATLSQTPVHELIGEMINLSAEALAAAEAGRDRKVDSDKTSLGESHEQELWLAGRYMGVEVPDDAQVVWRDTSARSFAAIVDGLGKLVDQLGIPPQELWERIPGTTKSDVERWKAVAAEGDSLTQLTALLDRQAQPGQQQNSGLVLPPGVSA